MYFGCVGKNACLAGFLPNLSGLREAIRFDNIVRVRRFCEGLRINCLGLLILTILVDINVVRLKCGKFPDNYGERPEFAVCDQFSIPPVVYVAASISLSYLKLLGYFVRRVLWSNDYSLPLSV